MKVKVLKAFGSYSKGQVIPEMPNNQARELLARGLVEEVALVAKPLQSPSNRAMPASPAQRRPLLKLK